MARYHVIWSAAAVDSLAMIWNDAVQRQAIADAANALDRELSDSASLKGHDLSEGLRFVEAPPLRVVFEVSEDDRAAKIVGVRLLHHP